MDLPDYDYLKRLFRDLYLRQPPTAHVFDWEAIGSGSGHAGPMAGATADGVSSVRAANDGAFRESNAAGEPVRGSDDNNSSQAAALEDSQSQKGAV